MKTRKRVTFLFVVAILFIAALLLFACSDLTLDEPFVAGSDAALSDSSSVADVAESETDIDDPSKEESAKDESANTDAADSVADTGEAGGSVADRDEAGGSVENRDEVDKSDEDPQSGTSDSSNGEESEKAGDTSTDDEGNESSVREDPPIVKDGYTRMSSLSSDIEWVISVMGEEIGHAHVASGGYFVTDDLTEGTLELWGKVNEYDRVSLYVCFESTGKYHEVYFRTEMPVVQIDLNEAELALLLPTPSLEEDTDQEAGESTDDSSDETVQEETTGGNEPALDQDAEPVEEKGEDESGSDQDEQEENVEQNVEQNGEENAVEEAPNDGNLSEQEPAEDPGSDSQGESDPQEVRCVVCGVLLTEDAEHLPECVNYATIPLLSAAHDFLDVLPGVREDLDVTVIDEENEIYSFSLNYLTAEGANAVKDLMRSCTVLNETLLGDGSMEYRVRKSIGSKVFTLVTRVTPRAGYYAATIALSGFSLA
ncbi:MAG: hypothetical protein J6U39_04585 [Clostridia bacterium]|nr:hypothetical protein [Clostridia bacterium]